MELNALNALSPLDGRYGSKTAPLRDFFSEYALIKYRVIVEIEWLKALAAEPAIAEVPAFSADAIALLDGIADNFSVAHSRAEYGPFNSRLEAEIEARKLGFPYLLRYEQEIGDDDEVQD